jgi:hypothetical protein
MLHSTMQAGQQQQQRQTPEIVSKAAYRSTGNICTSYTIKVNYQALLLLLMLPSCAYIHKIAQHVASALATAEQHGHHCRCLPSQPLHLQHLPLHLQDLPLHLQDLPLRLQDLPLPLRDLPLRLQDLPLRLQDLPLRLQDLPLRLQDLPLPSAPSAAPDPAGCPISEPAWVPPSAGPQAAAVPPAGAP